MFLKVIPSLSLIMICASYPRSEKSLEPAVSFQSFYREDVPISYTFSSVHNYSTPKTELANKRDSNYEKVIKLSPKYEQGIQYAPVPGYQENRLRKSTIVDTIGQTSPGKIRRDHLEPRLIPEQERHHPHVSYIPGKNIAVRPLVNRYSGQNPLYMNFVKNERNNINNQWKYVDYKKPNQNEIQSAVTENTRTHSDHTIEVPKPESFVSTTNRYFREKSIQHEPHRIENQTQQLFPVIFKSPKYLNTARKYNIAQLPNKAPVDDDDMFRKARIHTQKPFLDRIVINNQAYTPIKQRSSLLAPSELIEMTQLYPIKSRRSHFKDHPKLY